jgi:acid phosphatase type 7
LIAFAFEQCIISDDKSRELQTQVTGQTEWAASTLSQISDAGDHDVLQLPGDLSYANWNQPLWDSWGRLVQPLASARPWMVTARNNERERSREPGRLQRLRTFVPYNARWRMPQETSGSVPNLYYSFDAAGGAVHVVMLGSYADLGEGSEQHLWLRRDLVAVDHRRTPWVVALMHVPWYNTNRAHHVSTGTKLPA